MAKFKTVITTVGAAKIAAVLAGTDTIILDNTAKMAVGDGNGTLPTPVPSQTKLVHEVHRAPLNNASIDTRDPKNIVAELVIPPETGGFWLREMALYDAAGTLLAVGNMAETYKPSLSEGAGRKLVIRMVIAVSDVSAVTITMDASTVMATNDYVDKKIDDHEQSRNHPDATLTQKGFTQLNNATNSASELQSVTPKAVKTVMDETNLKAPLDSPNLTGTPQAPTAPPGTNTLQLANTAFVRAAIAALINSSPGTLDTLSELAAALGNDANFATTMTNALAAKAPLASPVLTGTPLAPTAVAGTSNQQLATTAFVQAAVAALVNSSPAALDTLNELAAALGNDPNFATTITNALAGKQSLDATLTALAALATGANKLPYFTGPDTASQTDLTGVGRDIIGKGSIADVLTYLGLDVALQNKQDANGTLSSLAFFTGSVNKLPYFDGNGDYITTGLTTTGRGLLSATSIADLLDYLTLGPIASAADVTAGTAKKLIDAARLKAWLPKRIFAANDYIRIPDEPGGLIVQWVYSSSPGVIAETEIPVNLPIPFPNQNLGSVVSTLGTDANTDIFFQVKSNESGLVRVLAQVPTSNPNMTHARAFIVSIGF